jgi:hypothetical protein
MSLTPEQLNEINRISREITQLREQEAQYANNTTAAGQQQLQIIRNQLTTLRQQRDTQSQQLRTTQDYAKEIAAFGKSYAKLSSNVKAQLQTQTDINNQTSVYKKLGDDIALSKLRESGLTGEALAMEQERGALMSEINASLLTQAKATAKALDDAAGLTEFDKMRRDLKETLIDLSDEERKRLEDAIDQQETLYKKQERIKSIQESQKGLYDAMPESLRSGVDFAQKLGDTLKTAGAGAVAFMLLAAVVTAAVSSFTALDEAAKSFREETGLTNSQMEGIKSNANEIAGEFGHLGVEAKDALGTSSALVSEFGDIANFSKETTAALTVMNKNFGIAAKDSAKVQSIFESVGGLSSETAASVQMQAVEMAKLAGVAPAKVMADIAENAEAASTLFKGDLTSLTKNAIQARRMGSSLKEQVALSEKLLDFEGGIEEELVAATFVSGQFNLSKARALAIEGETAAAAEETLRQIQRSGDFRKQDYHTQMALAKASGMTVEEINKQLNAQDKLNSLTEEQKAAAEEAIEAGLDITNIKAEDLALETQKFAAQQEQQATLEKIQNQFMGMVATVGSQLVPILEDVVPILTMMLEPIGLMVKGLASFIGYVRESEPLLATLLGVVTAIAVQKGLSYMFTKNENEQSRYGLILERAKAIWDNLSNKKKERGLLLTIADAAMTAYRSIASIPFIGWALGIGVAAAAISYGMGLFSKAGDVMSPADGKTRVSTKEGGLFELSPNDDLVAAPGAAAALAGGGTGGGEGGTTLNVDLSTLSAPLNAMINEIRALRADMASGKIAVYMDTSKVTSTIGKKVDAATRNNYSLGQA